MAPRSFRKKLVLPSAAAAVVAAALVIGAHGDGGVPALSAAPLPAAGVIALTAPGAPPPHAPSVTGPPVGRVPPVPASTAVVQSASALAPPE